MSDLCECGAPRVPHWCHRALAFVGVPAPGSASPPERAEDLTPLDDAETTEAMLESALAESRAEREQIAATARDAIQALSALRERVRALAEHLGRLSDLKKRNVSTIREAYAHAQELVGALVDDGERER